MSLFVKRVSGASQGQNKQRDIAIPSHIPTVTESGLGRVEFEGMLALESLQSQHPQHARREK